jgi:hypothetical protein
MLALGASLAGRDTECTTPQPMAAAATMTAADITDQPRPAAFDASAERGQEAFRSGAANATFRR